MRIPWGRLFGVFLTVLPVLLAAGVNPIAPASFLRADGPRIVDRHGNSVLLRGVNIGGWLLLEAWMCPFDKDTIKDDYSVRQILEQRFGEGQADRLLDGYEDAWFTDNDLSNIAGMGMNVVRVPFWYRTLQSESGAWRPDAFVHLDWIVQHAAMHGLYTLFDLHGAPGGQSTDQPCGRIRKSAEYWSSAIDRDRAAETWKRVAEHFRGNPAVAGYDLLNEPQGAPNVEALWANYDRLYRAVRQVDPDHMIAIEGCWSGNVNGKQLGWGLDVLPPPRKFGWSNVLYELHVYEWDWNNLQKQIKTVDSALNEIKNHSAWNVPCYVGEFNSMGQPKAWTHAIQTFTSNNISWTLWSYKSAGGSGTNSWGVYNRNDPSPPRPDLQHDSADLIAAKWSKWTTENAFSPNPMLSLLLKQK